MPKVEYPRMVYRVNPETKIEESLVVKDPDLEAAAVAEGWTNDLAGLRGDKRARYQAEDEVWPGDRPGKSTKPHVVIPFPAMLYSPEYDRKDPGATGSTVIVKTQTALDDALAQGWLAAPPPAKPTTAPAGPTHPVAPVAKPEKAEKKEKVEEPAREANDPFDSGEVTAAVAITYIEEMTDVVSLQAVQSSEEARDPKKGGPRRTVMSAVDARIKTLTKPSALLDEAIAAAPDASDDGISNPRRPVDDIENT